MALGSDADPDRRCQFRMYLGVDLSPEASHSAPIQAIVEDGDVVYTGSRDATIKEWKLSRSRFHCQGTFRGHTDWVTDLRLHRQTVISASCDRSIRVWDRASGQCRATSRCHADYIECIDVDHGAELLVSGGLDRQLYLWDLNQVLEPIAHLHRDENCSSVYCVYVGDNLIITGSSDKVVRIWDSRTCRIVDRLSGHQGNVRGVLMRSRSVVSASSDGTVRIWDVGERRCTSVYSPLTTRPVWTVSADKDMANLYAAGRSDQITCIDVHKRQASLVATLAPHLHCHRLHLNRPETALFVATSDTALSYLDVSSLQQTPSDLDAEAFQAHTLTESVVYACPPCRSTTLDIIGQASVVAAVALNDGRRVCVKNGRGEIDIWDVVEQRKLNTFRKHAILEEIVDRYNTDVSIPNWFTIDLHLGSLGIVLQRATVFSAEIWIQPSAESPSQQIKLGLCKVNLGAMALKNVLKIWVSILSRRSSEKTTSDSTPALVRSSASPHPADPASDGSGPDQIPLPEPSQPVPSPKHAVGTRIGDFETELDCLIMTQQLIGTSSALFRILNLYDPSEYAEIVAPWVLAFISVGAVPPIRRSELRFEVQPHPQEHRLPSLAIGTSMKADESVTIRHLSAYIIQQLPAVSEQIRAYQSGSDPDHPECIFDLICQDQVLGPCSSLRTVRAFAWKNKKIPFTVFYKLAKQ